MYVQPRTWGPPKQISPPPDLNLDYSDISQGQQIGRGGNSIVQKVDTEVSVRQETVAVKQPNCDGTLHREIADRFIEEAKLWDSLTSVEADRGGRRNELPK